MAPLFSIITVTYNAAATIGPTIESVNNQTFDKFEHIIIDGASTDSTLEIVSRLSSRDVRIVSEPDDGLYDAMNKGLAMASGEYVIFLNAGDRFHSPDVLQMLADAALNNDFPGVIYGQTDIVDNAGTRLGARHLEAPPELSLDSFSRGMTVCHQAFVALKKITSNFNTSFRFSADYDWCIRCLQRSRHNHYIDAVLIDYLNEGITTGNRRKSLVERFRIMSHYYGFFTTVINHLGFIPRFIRRSREEKKFNAK